MSTKEQLATARQLAEIENDEDRARAWRENGAEDLGVEGFRIARVTAGAGENAAINRGILGEIKA